MKNIILSLVVSLLLAPNIASAANPFIDIRDQLDQLSEEVSANTTAINNLRSIQVYVDGIRRGTLMRSSRAAGLPAPGSRAMAFSIAHPQRQCF